MRKSPTFRDELEKIIKGQEVDIQVNENLTFVNNSIYDRDNVFSFLFFGGYLKCKEKYFKRVRKHKEYLHCKLVPTNVECEMIFEKVIIHYLEGFLHINLIQLLGYLTKGQIEDFRLYLTDILRDVVSYHDTMTENSYHMLMLGMLVFLYDYEIISNKEAGYGRVDIIVLHKTDKSKPAIVMELKVLKDETKDEALEKAIKQIIEKNYISYVKNRGYNNIIAFGLVFDGKKCWVREI
jgi:hypothetical protein